MSSIMSYFSTVLPIKEFIQGWTKSMASVPEPPLLEPCKHCIHQCGHRQLLLLSTGVCIGIIISLIFIKPGNINFCGTQHFSGNSNCNLPSSANKDAKNAADTSQDNEESFQSLASKKRVTLLNMNTETCVPLETCVQPEAETEAETSKPTE